MSHQAEDRSKSEQILDFRRPHVHHVPSSVHPSRSSTTSQSRDNSHGSEHLAVPLAEIAPASAVSESDVLSCLRGEQFTTPSGSSAPGRNTKYQDPRASAEPGPGVYTTSEAIGEPQYPSTPDIQYLRYTPVHFEHEEQDVGPLEDYYGQSVAIIVGITELSTNRSSRFLNERGEPSQIFKRMVDALFFYLDDHAKVPLRNTGRIEPEKFMVHMAMKYDNEVVSVYARALSQATLERATL